MAGETFSGPDTHSHKGNHATFGLPRGALRPNTQQFVKKNSGKMGSNELPEIHRFRYRTEERRPPIPAFNEKPIMGLTSDKNYVKSNIVENVTMGSPA